MAKSIGSIEIILGKGTVINLKGEEKQLVNNLKLYEDDVIATGEDTTLLIKLRNGDSLSLGSNRVLSIDESVTKNDLYSDDETQAKVDRIQDLLEEGTDDEEMEETADGESLESNSSLQTNSVVHHKTSSEESSTDASVLDSFNAKNSLSKDDSSESIIAPFDAEGVVISVSNIITNDTTPIITGTTNDPDADIVINVGGDDYTATNNGDGTWTLLIDQELDEGDSTITVVATDPSGNTTEVTATITVDTILNDSDDSNGGKVVTIDSITEDTGHSSNDFITKDTQLVINGTFDNESGNTIRIMVDGTEYHPNIDSNIWALDLRDSTLSDGEHEVIAIVRDLAGNEVSSSQTITIDTQVSTDTISTGTTEDGQDATITLNPISDDNIINKEESSSVIISGSSTAQDGSTVSLFIGNSSLTSVVIENGNFSYTVPSDIFSRFSDGIYNVRAEVIADAAGNIAESTQTIILDTHIDNISSGGFENHELITITSITDDTGVNSSDFITSDNTLTIKGTYDSSNNNSLQIIIGGETYTPTTNGNTWELTTSPLSDGEQSLDITIMDSAGNTKTLSQAITIDTLADIGDGTTEATLTLDDISDSFINANEAGNILTLTGSSNVIGAEVIITLNGGEFTSVLVDSEGKFSVNVSTTEIAKYPDGTYNLKATIITDDAGNSISVNQDVILDTTLDSQNDYDGSNVTIDTISQDDGIANDFITTDKTIKINGTFNAEEGNTLLIKVDSTLYTLNDSQLTIDGNNWELNLENTPLSDALYNITAILKDEAGNSETVTQNIQIVDSTDRGVINLNEISDNYINAQEAQETLLISGNSTQIGENIHFTLNGNPLTLNGIEISTTVDSNGQFSIEIPADTFTAYIDGEYIVEAFVTSPSDGITYSDSENVFLDRDATGVDGGGTTLSGEDATIALNSIGDGFVNALESQTGLLLTGTTTAVEGTNISFIVNTSSGEYTITQNSNGQAITAKSDGTFSTFVALNDLIDNSTITIQAEVIADKAGNTTTSDIESLSVDLSAGTLTSHTPDTAVYESALDTGSAPSLIQRETGGNLFEGDEIGNSTLSSVSANGINATQLSENSDILTLTTDSGTIFIATRSTTFNNTTYDAGDYLYILEDASSSTLDSFTYTLSDPAGNKVSSDLNINIIDDVTKVNEDGVIHKYLSEDNSGYTTNLILTLDISESMNFDADGSAPGDYHYENGGFLGLQRIKVSDYDESTIRIDLAKDALKNLIDKYAELGDVNVQVISFNDSAVASTMLDADSAKSYIDGLTASGGTDYQSALDTAQTNPLDSYPDANTTQYYFISDGQPNEDITADNYTQWQTYIKDSPIDNTYAIGVGEEVNLDQLNNVSGTDGESIVINSITDLDSTLIQTVNSALITGNLTSFDVDGTAINIGADGGYIAEINMYNQAGDITDTLLYDINNTSQSITTELGGLLNINFEDGTYSYSIDYNDSIASMLEKFDVVVEGTDGERVTNSVNVHLENVLDENFALNDTAIDGGSGYDTLVLSGTQSLNLDNISDIQNIEAIDMHIGDNQVLNLNVEDVISMTDANNELFIYGENQDSVTIDTTLLKQDTTTTDSNGKVFDVYSDVNATVIVNIEQEIVVS